MRGDRGYWKGPFPPCVPSTSMCALVLDEAHTRAPMEAKRSDPTNTQDHRRGDPQMPAKMGNYGALEFRGLPINFPRPRRCNVA